MNDNKLIQCEQKDLQKSLNRRRRQIPIRNWFGWGGSYSHSKKKIGSDFTIIPKN